MGSYPSEGGRFKAARLPKGWTGPVSMSGFPGFRKEARIFFRLRSIDPFPRSFLPEQNSDERRARSESDPLDIQLARPITTGREYL
jgi:hypothetical protein